MLKLKKKIDEFQTANQQQKLYINGIGPTVTHNYADKPITGFLAKLLPPTHRFVSPFFWIEVIKTKFIAIVIIIIMFADVSHNVNKNLNQQQKLFINGIGPIITHNNADIPITVFLIKSLPPTISLFPHSSRFRGPKKNSSHL